MRVDRNSRGVRRFTLSNGQVWEHTETTSIAHVAEGAQITLEKAAFGTFRMVTPAGAGLRVRRLR